MRRLHVGVSHGVFRLLSSFRESLGIQRKYRLSCNSFASPLFRPRRNSMAILLFLFFLAAEGSFVMERHRVCSCCDLQLSFNPQCDNTWTINQSDFAEASVESSSCHHPCDHIEHGVMKLKVCVAVNHTSLCYGERNLVTEEKTYYSTQPCADSGVQIMGLVPLLLLLLKLPELTLM